ncbi:hypothetical protein ACIP4X_17785 [Streptomyces sp. NPDC088817]|uniref:hypothetical protein n=1 Tax=unclassified Streptomyces TaxID=2593676 RepID=UPI002DD98FAF|nr:hypothetical protein [Streptomyces sp. NBC_01788]WSB29684.1 hypothetical protein OIE49_29470 [Streptomyces sp. NBC_01788]
MICTRCAHAADNQLGKEEHCDAQGGPDAACLCQHRTDRYRRTAPAAPEQMNVVIHVQQDRVETLDAVHTARRSKEV